MELYKCTNGALVAVDVGSEKRKREETTDSSTGMQKWE